jgi:hypothetical protein
MRLLAAPAPLHEGINREENILRISNENIHFEATRSENIDGEAKRSEKIEAKRSEMKRKNWFLVFA